LPRENIENRFGGKFTIFSNMSLSADVISRIVQCLIGLNVYKIILFGSYARGTANEDSDIDLVVILDTDEFAKTVDERLDRKQPINKSIREIRKDFPMDIVVYSKAEYKYLKDRGDFFVREIEETGKELYGK
jgi:predicted nucleotidyltransferase